MVLGTGTMDQPLAADNTATTPRWWVLHTLSRQEKAVAAALASRRVEHFLPLVKKVRYHGRRKLVSELPLFPGYVFLRGSVEDAWELDRNKRLAQIIEVTDQSQLDWELQNIRLAVEAEAALDPYPYLEKGVRVEVRSGPFRGMQGVVESRTALDRLILQVQTLGQAASVEIDGALLDVVGD